MGRGREEERGKWKGKKRERREQDSNTAPPKRLADCASVSVHGGGSGIRTHDPEGTRTPSKRLNHSAIPPVHWEVWL